MKYLVCVFFFALWILSCQTKQLMESQPVLEKENQLVFSENKYLQKISIYLKNEDNKKISFDGAIKKTNQTLSLYAFTSAGFRIFTLNDNNGKVEFYDHLNQFTDKKEFILKLYPVIKKIFTLKKTDQEFLNKSFFYELEKPIGLVEVALQSQNKGNEINLIKVIKDKYFEFIIENLN